MNVPPSLGSLIVNCAGPSGVVPVFVMLKEYLIVSFAAPYVCELADLVSVNTPEGWAEPFVSVRVPWFDVTPPAVAVATLVIVPVVTSDSVTV